LQRISRADSSAGRYHHPTRAARVGTPVAPTSDFVWTFAPETTTATFGAKKLLACPQHKSGPGVRLIEEMRSEPVWTTVINRSVNDARPVVQFELERIQAKR